MIVEIKPTQQQRDYAEKLFKDSEENSVHGYLGKSIVAEYLSCKNKGSKYGYDLIHRGFGVKVFTAMGQKSNLGIVPKKGMWLEKESYDVYVFVRCKEDLSMVYICGWMQRVYFLDKADYFKEEDNYQLNYTEMESITEF